MAEAGVGEGIAAAKVGVRQARRGAACSARDNELYVGGERKNGNILGKDCLRWRDAAETAAARARTAKKRIL